VEHTEEWTLIEPPLPWHEQREYELLRPIVVFGDTPAQRARQTGAAARTLHEKARRFDEEGVPSLFPTRRGPTLRPEIRRLIVDLKVQHPPLSLGEIATICYVRTRRRSGKHTLGWVSAEVLRQGRLDFVVYVLPPPNYGSTTVDSRGPRRLADAPALVALSGA
jgi:putative transposase